MLNFEFLFKIHSDGSDWLLQTDDQRSSDISRKEQRETEWFSAAVNSFETKGRRFE